MIFRISTDPVHGTVRPAARRSRRVALALGSMGLLLVPFLGAALAQSGDDFEQAPISYSKSQAVDPIARLQEQLDKKQATLKYDAVHGYLPSVLQQLKVPVSSQMLVFSKTSFQRDLISPRAPRAIYFNDQVYVGSVRNGPVLEFTAVDPQLGAVFYTLRQEPDKTPKFVRQTHECLSCHSSAMTRGVPGHVMRSVWTDRTGMPLLEAGTFLTTDESPFTERWGGWYVSGTHGDQRHMGNLITHSAAQAANPNLDAGANVTDLKRRFDAAAYLSPHSDLVALMVIEHQAHIQNLITRANYETRRAMAYEAAVGKDLGVPPGGHLDSTHSRVKSVGEPLVQALLFTKETALTAPVAGSAPFAREFAAQGPRDRRGRSLRAFDLKQRLFRYPCSYTIYSEAFDGLPDLAREYVYRRLWDVLSGKDTGAEYARLTPADRQAIREILLETKPEFGKHRPSAELEAPADSGSATP